MCGIAGIWNFDGRPLDAGELDRFTDTLIHRGPDGRGVWTSADGSLGLGQRRLAILDTRPEGLQPMSFADGRLWITYNGEIYNFLEIREELKSLGYSFRSESDTEVILAAYHRWGEDCQFKFNGMWAFAIRDEIANTLFLSRDRFGVKPLHYSLDAHRLAFASETKAFLALNDFRPDFDSESLGRALLSNTSLEGTDKTLFAGLYRLPAGHSLTCSPGTAPRLRRWWNTLDHRVDVPRDYDEQCAAFRELFFDACRIRMRSDVPVGTALSGGLDSSSVASTIHALGTEHGSRERIPTDWRRAFIATYAGTEQDEKAYADEVVTRTGAVPVYCAMTPGAFLENLDSILFQLEDLYDIADGPWQLYREYRRQGVVVSLDGHGGDELLAGYHRYAQIMLDRSVEPSFHPLAFYRARGILEAMYAADWPGRDPSGAHRLLVQTAKRLLFRLPGADFVWQRWKGGPFSARTMGSPDSEAPQTAAVPDSFLRLTCRTDFPGAGRDLERLSDPIDRALYFDFHYTVLPTILRNFDRLSMAHGVEVRAPLLDWRIVTYGFSLPVTSKLGGGFTKRILRDALRGVLPEKIRRRKTKLGFVSPLRTYFRDARLKEILLDTFASREFLESPYWHGERLRAFAGECYQTDRLYDLRFVWPFFHAARLATLFANRKRELQTRVM